MTLDLEYERLISMLEAVYSLHKARIDLLKDTRNHNGKLDVFLCAILHAAHEQLGDQFVRAGFQRPLHLTNLMMVQKYLVELAYRGNREWMEAYYRFPFRQEELQDFNPSEEMKEFYKIILEGFTSRG